MGDLACSYNHYFVFCFISSIICFTCSYIGITYADKKDPFKKYYENVVFSSHGQNNAPHCISPCISANNISIKCFWLRSNRKQPVTPVKFGTSGWRGIIAREFTWERVNCVVDAIGLQLLREGRNSIVVGGDCRFLSPELAESTADRMAGYGFEVLLSHGPCPTPVLSHACRKGDHGGVINFTASHNPPLYNGIKFSPWHGGPADSDMTTSIEKLIEAGEKPERGSG